MPRHHACMGLIKFLCERRMTQTTAAATLSGIVTAEMLSGVLSEVIGLLPVVIPVAITFIGVRKGISFLLGMLKSA